MNRTAMPAHMFETAARLLYEGALTRAALRDLVARFPDPEREATALRAERDYIAYFCAWYTAPELAGMPGMPATARGVRRLLDLLEVPRRQRFGCKRKLEFAGSFLPLVTRAWMPRGRRVTPQAKARALAEYDDSQRRAAVRQARH